MMYNSLKIAGLSIVAVILTAGTAIAGSGEDCKDKKSAKVTSKATMTSTAQTAVLTAASEDTDMKAKRAYSFDDALKACQEKGVTDLQACVDYKTGQVNAKPKS